KGSPADKAGIKAGDIILSANGRVVERSAELPTIIGALRPGAEAVLEVWRERAVRKLTLKVAEVVADAQAKEEGSEKSAAPEAADKLGLVVRDITAEERGEAKLEGGVLILRATGAARDAGVQSGDVVLGVNGRSVKSMREFRDAVAKSGKTVALLVQREGVQIFVPIRVN
ncbi:MAG: putative serine protease MucD, partial [Pseudomonadota bacterium]